jgi:hypothetical protein
VSLRDTDCESRSDSLTGVTTDRASQDFYAQPVGKLVAFPS